MDTSPFFSDTKRPSQFTSHKSQVTDSWVPVGETTHYGGGALEYMTLPNKVAEKEEDYYFSAPGSSKYGDEHLGSNLMLVRAGDGFIRSRLCDVNLRCAQLACGVVGCCLESLGVTSVGALYHVASEEPDSNEGVQYFLAAQEHGGARSTERSMPGRTRTPTHVAPMYVGGGRYWGHVRRNPFGKTDGRTLAL
eukprot:scaffold2786_cov84-Skeletonema_marinoi.AAC.2